MTLGIFGAGGMGLEFLEMFRQEIEDRFEKVYFIDDVTKKKEIGGIEVYTYEQFKNDNDPSCSKIIITQGEPFAKNKLFKLIHGDGYSLTSFVHPSTYVAESASIGNGVIIECDCIVSSNALIMDNSCVLAHSIVGHNCTIGKHSQISSMVATGGGSKIGAMCFVGMQASILNEVFIGDGSIVAQASAVMRDVPEGVIAMGNPARVIRKNTEQRVFK